MTSARISDEDIQSVFEVFDVDGTGSIDAAELLTALRSLGWGKATEAEVQKLIAQAHEEEEAELEEVTEEELETLRKNRRDGLNYSQFSDLIRRKQRNADGPEEVLAAFRLFDRDNKGRISRADLAAAGKVATGSDVSDAVLDEILRLADMDKDGFLIFDEFRKAVSKGDVAEAQLASTIALGATIISGAEAAAQAQKQQQKESEAAMDEDDQRDMKPEEQVIAGVKVSVIGGKLAKTEVRRALVVCGYDHDTLPPHVYDELFSESDEDQDGLLTLDEYCKLLVGFGEQVDGY